MAVFFAKSCTILLLHNEQEENSYLTNIEIESQLVNLMLK